MDSGGLSDSNASGSRKRPRESRENETPSQRLKREKAAERQRRKRERDRNAAGLGIMGGGFSNGTGSDSSPQQAQQAPSTPQPDFSGQDSLTPDEAARRDRVRAAARERQRKHRQLVKQRKMRELGLDMGNEIMPGMEEVHYRVNADGQYQQVLPHEMQPPHLQQQQMHPAAMGQHEPPFPQGQPLGGQTFASTLLLSFSCAPLLKQHLLRTLAMTNEELASLEPIIAEAWDQWDHQRRVHYAEQAAKGGPAAGPSSYDMNATPDQQQPQHHSAPNPNPTNPYADPNQPTPNEFRARFHRPLVAPSPFRTYPGASTDTQPQTTGSTPTSTSGSVPSDPIDPHLATNGNAGSSDGRS